MGRVGIEAAPALWYTTSLGCQPLTRGISSLTRGIILLPKARAACTDNEEVMSTILSPLKGFALVLKTSNELYFVDV